MARRFLFAPRNELYRHLYAFGATFVLLGVLPLAIACMLWDERPSEWGITLGKGKLAGLTVSLALFIMMLPVLAHASADPVMSAGHPLSRLAAKYGKALLLYEGFLFLYMAGWEFFFRGFLLFGLRKSVGDAAIYLQVIPYVLMHAGRSEMEALASIPAGIALGHLAARTGSVWYGIMLHWLCAVALDLLIIYRPL